MSIMNQSAPTKVQKAAAAAGGKRGSMNRPQSAVEGGEGWYQGPRSECDNELAAPPYRAKLHALFRQIEREFEALYQENQNCEWT